MGLMPVNLQDITVPAVMLFSIGGGIVWLTWWLSTQFTSFRKLVYDRTEEIKQLFLDKLEYHERHDDQRFMAVSNDIWSIKMRNAAIDGKRILEETTNNNHKKAKSPS